MEVSAHKAENEIAVTKMPVMANIADVTVAAIPINRTIVTVCVAVTIAP